ncbi:uncharacterized protein LOC128240861 isoform X2 [Mya arenaria]|uniref:uncharacterized protein LOC128240861 isoform X2 n=1 Tax=Mya arenaria TaxID=6604 RepID=UPI0022E1B062|nr:uncharacterized protein LOC128240861 isoform X2 [Mya arenaria]
MSSLHWKITFVIIVACRIYSAVEEIPKSVLTPGGVVPVIRGSNLTLTCSNAAAGTALHCNWYSKVKEGPYSLKVWINLENCSKIYGNETLYGFECLGNNVFILTIYNVQNGSDGDYWKCDQVFENTNTDSEPIRLDVKGVRNSCPVEAPRYFQRPGSEVQLQLTTSLKKIGLGSYQIIKGGTLYVTISTYDGSIVDPTEEMCAPINCRYSGKTSSGNFSISLEDVNVKDTGIYHLIENVEDDIKACATLYILGAPEKPSIAVPKNVSAGDNITISCHSKSTTVPGNHELSLLYNWYINGQKNPNNTRYVFSLSKEKLAIVGIRKEDAELTFHCYATENITYGLESPGSLTSRFTVIHGPQIPDISVPSEFTVIEGHRSIYIECKSDCWPDCTYKWINSSSNYYFAANGTLSFHTVTRYLITHGNYTCVSTNMVTGNRKESTIYVLVQYAPDVEVIASNATSRDIQTQLRCSAHGNPDLYTYKWQQNWPNSILTRNWKTSGDSILNLTDLNVPVVVLPKKTKKGRYVLFSNLKEPVELNITVFSNNGLISTNISRIPDNIKNTTLIRTIDVIIQLPVFGATVPAKGWLIFITFFLEDTNDLTAYDVIFTNEIGSVSFAVEIKQKETSESSVGPLIGGVTGGVFALVIVLVAIIISTRHKHSINCHRKSKLNSRNVKQENSTTRDEVPVEADHFYDQVGTAMERPEYTELKKDDIGQVNAYDELKPREVNGEYENAVTITQTGIHFYNN